MNKPFSEMNEEEFLSMLDDYSIKYESGDGVLVMDEFCITIPGCPVSKKNSQQIFKNSKTGQPFITQSKAYKAYEKAAGWFLRPYRIEYPCNVKAVYFMDSRRRVDLTNLLSATDDILVKYGVLKDDNRNIVAGHDGSRVLYDKQNPRVEITITPIENYGVWKAK